MSHNISPNAYRLGRTQLWSNVPATTLAGVLWKAYYIYPISLTEAKGHHLENSSSMRLVYYPVYSVYRYRSRFLYPRFYRHLKLLTWISDMSFDGGEELLSKIWARSLYLFNNRFTILPVKPDWQEAFREAMLRGIGEHHWYRAIDPIYKWSVISTNRQYDYIAQDMFVRSRLLFTINKFTTLLLTALDNPAESSNDAELIQLVQHLQTMRRNKWVNEFYELKLKSKLNYLVSALVYVRGGGYAKRVNLLKQELKAVIDFNKVKEEEFIRQKERDGKKMKPKHHNVFNEATIDVFENSPYNFSSIVISAIIGFALRRFVRVSAVNVFRYMLVKGIMKPADYLNHLFQFANHKTKRNRFTYNTYYDIINIFYLQTKFTNIEWLVLKIIKYSVFKIHRRNIKLKYFLRFIHDVIELIRPIAIDILLFRIVIHGKMKGGSRRTQTFTVGYGKPPRTSIGFNLKYCYDNIYTKYGEFGMHLLVGRANPTTPQE